MWAGGQGYKGFLNYIFQNPEFEKQETSKQGMLDICMVYLEGITNGADINLRTLIFPQLGRGFSIGI